MCPVSYTHLDVYKRQGEGGLGADSFRQEGQRPPLHQPSQQPLDTLYTLRLDPGRQTVVTLIFIREAFGYKEPLFPPAMLDEFMLQKLDAHRTK